MSTKYGHRKLLNPPANPDPFHYLAIQSPIKFGDIRMRSLFGGSRLIFLSFCLLSFSISGLCSDPGPTLRFVENKNQWAGDIRFMSDVSSGRVAFMNDRFRFFFFGRDTVHYGKAARKNNVPRHTYNDDGAHTHGRYTNLHVYDVQFIDANDLVQVRGTTELVTRYNYFRGADRKSWASNARSYAGVSYTDIYQGIDLDVYSVDERIKYEWAVSPQINPYQIKLKYNGVEDIHISDGDLLIRTSVNEITELKPFAYQMINGQQVHVPCEFHLEGNIVSYSFPEGYDRCEKLIIDPILIFSAYSGSFSDNWGNTASYDNRGNVYSGGIVSTLQGGIANGFPVTPGAYQTAAFGDEWDIGILKYDSSGTHLLYATYLGGNGSEVPQSLVVNSRNELLILGITGSSNFPVTNATTFKGGPGVVPLDGVPCLNGTDIFIAKLSENGDALLAGTYLGGTRNDGINFIAGDMGFSGNIQSPLARNYGDQFRGDIITGQNDTVYIASSTLSTNFTGMQNSHGGGVSPNIMDAVVVKLAPDLSTIKSARYIGGAGADAAYSIKLKNDKVYVGGGTNSTTFPGINGIRTNNQNSIDGWVAELSNKTLVPVNATYLGTSSYDQVYFIDINEAGDIYAFGQTTGHYPVVGNVYSNPNAGQFVHRLSPDLKTTIFSTVVGTVGTATTVQPNISPTAFLVSDCGVLYLSGWGGFINAPVAEDPNGVRFTRNYVGGSTLNMPLSADAYQHTTTGNEFYFMVLSADASSFLYGTYLGGTDSPTHVDGGTSRFDKRGIVYHAVCAGCGGESDFPAVNAPAGHTRNRSSNCNNAVFKFDLTLLKARLQTNTIHFNMPGIQSVCIPDALVFQNQSFGGTLYEWDMGDGTLITKTDTSFITHAYKAPGRYLVKLKCINPGTCKGVDSTDVFIDVYIPESYAQDDDALCKGDAYTLKANGGATYAWVSDDPAFGSSLAQPQVNPPDTAQYYVKIVEANGCVRYDTVQLNVIPLIKPDFEFSRISECTGRSRIRITSLTDSVRTEDQMFFDWGDGTTSDQPEDMHQYQEDGIYHIRLVTAREFCVTEKTADIPIFTINIPNIITPGVPEGKNDKFTIRFGQNPEDEVHTPGDYGFRVDLTIYNRWGNILFQKEDYQYDWAGEGLASGIYYYEVSIQDHATCKSWLQLVR